MHGASPICCTQKLGSSMRLLARIVDGAGRPIRPWQVAAIEFSVIADGSRRSGADDFDGEPPITKLCASEVFLPRLTHDASWTVDVAGYNFRHEFTLSDFIPGRPVSRRFELRYLFTGKDGTKSIVQFRMKAA